MRLAAATVAQAFNTLFPCYYPDVKNITITLDEKTAAWARNHAAEHDMSLSRFVGELLDRTMRESREYRSAMRAYLSREPTRLKKSGTRYPRREELYDGRGLR